MAAPKHTPWSWEAPMPDITDEKLALIEHDEGEASDDDIAAIIARLRKAEAERDAAIAEAGALREGLAAALRRAEEAEARGFRAGLLRAAEECESYAAVVADEYDDGPHSVHADVARHLAKELREIADRDAPAAQPDPPPSAQAVSNRLRAMLDEAMAEYPSLRVKFAKALKEIGRRDG